MTEARLFYLEIRAGWARPISKVFATALATILAGQPVARADWAFTHWGMTPEQVVSASGGMAHLIAPASRYRDDVAHWEMAAEGVIHDGDLTLQGGYMFDMRGGGLICVMYNATGNDVSKLRDGLIARYGRPSKDSDSGPLQDLTWHTPDNLELAINLKPLTAAVTHCAPGR